MPCAIITGTAGQDGSYLCELLLQKGYHVFGMVRRNSSLVLDRLKEARKDPKLSLMYGDVTDIASIFNIFKHASRHPAFDEGPLEVYNLAAQSHVKVSFETPVYTCNADALGVLNILEVVVQLNLTRKVRFYQASTSEMYGSSEPPQDENTPFHPRSPYAIAKLYAYWMVKNYREAHGIYAVNGVLFNHESERRGETFVSRKISRAVAHYAKQPATYPVLSLGNLHSERDWGHAYDYVIAMWKMLQQERPDDYVVATGSSYTVKHFVETAFGHVGVPLRWEGSGTDEKGYHATTGQLLVAVDARYFRPTEVDSLRGDATKARTNLGWLPSISFEELVRRMVTHDMNTFA